MGCGETLFIGDGGHVTCSWHACPNPGTADSLLAGAYELRFTDVATVGQAEKLFRHGGVL
jgi:hypothetical protein